MAMTLQGIGTPVFTPASGPWPTSLVVPSFACPTTNPGDRVILIVHALYSTNNSGPFRADWGADIAAQFGAYKGYVAPSSAGTVSSSITDLSVYSARRNAITFPLTIQPRKNDGTTFISSSGGGNFWCVMLAYAPSQPNTAASSQRLFNTSTSLGPVPAFSGAADSTTVCVSVSRYAFYPNESPTLPLPTAANGFTSRWYHPSTYPWGGDVRIFDKQQVLSGNPSSPVWSGNHPLNTYSGLVAVNFSSFDAPLGGPTFGMLGRSSRHG